MLLSALASIALLTTPHAEPAPTRPLQPDALAPGRRPDNATAILHHLGIAADVFVPPDGAAPGPPPRPCSAAEPFDTRATFEIARWPGGIVPYVFSTNVSTDRRAAMLAAMSEIEAVARIDFVPRSGQPGYLFIQNSSQNSAPVGYSAQSRTVNIFNWDYKFVMVHELMHALGFQHEQSRADRDNYVLINLANVCQTCCNGSGSCNHNFNRLPNTPKYGPYDFDSVMHYDLFAFSTNGRPTITVRTPHLGPTPNPAAGAVGQRERLSKFDRLGLRFNYPYSTDRFVKASHNSSGSGTFDNPWRSFHTAAATAPTGATLWIEPGSYSATGTYTRPLEIQAPQGGVHFGR